MSGTMATFAAIATAIIGLAIVAVLVSRNSNTTSVIQAGSSGFAQIIGAAVAPVSGTQIGSGGTGNQMGLSQGILA